MSGSWSRALLAHIKSKQMLPPDEEEAAAAWDQYMVGDHLLVAPVRERGATSRDVYLPAGTWYDFWTGSTTATRLCGPISTPP